MGHERKKRFDLYTFVAADALKRERPFPLKCNCGGIVTLMPPVQEEFVVCPSCESSIKILAVEGDPGFIIGANPNSDEPILIPVQGSERAQNLSAAEKRRLLEQTRNLRRAK
jgi:hypothetical protein